MEAEDVGSEWQMTVRRPDGLTAGRVAIVLALIMAVGPFGRPAVAQDTTAGKEVYGKWCAGCHGDNGAGDGAGAKHMIPPPRDFTGAIYQIRSTPSGQLPTDADLLRSIDEGLPGTAMPAWEDFLTEEEIWSVVLFLYDQTGWKPRTWEVSGK